MKTLKLIPIAALGLAGLAACDSDRTAESETPVSEAEVTTELPESVVSDPALNATAEAAAEMAASPPAQIVPVPVPANGAGGAQSGSQAASAQGNSAAPNR